MPIGTFFHFFAWGAFMPLYLSDIVCKQLRVVLLFLRGDIAGKILDRNGGRPLGECEQDAGDCSMRLVPSPRDCVRLPLQEVAHQDGLHRDSREKRPWFVLHQGGSEDYHYWCEGNGSNQPIGASTLWEYYCLWPWCWGAHALLDCFHSLMSAPGFLIHPI